MPTAGRASAWSITVAERPVLRSIDYQGLKRISKTDLQDKLTTQRIRVREGEPLSLGELQRVKALIEEMYGEKGYRFAHRPVHRRRTSAPNEKKVVFTVDEGDRVRISDIEFEGNTVFNDSRLRWTMKNTKESAFISRFTKEGPLRSGQAPVTTRSATSTAASATRSFLWVIPKVDVRTVDLKGNRRPSRTGSGGRSSPSRSRRGSAGCSAQVSIEGNKIYTEKNLLRAFEPQGDRLAALQGGRRRGQGDPPTPTTTPATSSPASSPS